MANKNTVVKIEEKSVVKTRVPMWFGALVLLIILTLMIWTLLDVAHPGYVIDTNQDLVAPGQHVHWSVNQGKAFGWALLFAVLTELALVAIYWFAARFSRN